MTRRTIDASAILAVLLGEPGQHVAARLIPGGIVSSVNLAEIMTKCIEKNVPPQLAKDYLVNSNVEFAAFDSDLAWRSSQLFATARKGVLSLGDRACIATAIKFDASIVTADRAWAALELPCPVELIR